MRFLISGSPKNGVWEREVACVRIAARIVFGEPEPAGQRTTTIPVSIGHDFQGMS